MCGIVGSLGTALRRVRAIRAMMADADFFLDTTRKTLQCIFVSPPPCSPEASWTLMLSMTPFTFCSWTPTPDLNVAPNRLFDKGSCRMCELHRLCSVSSARPRRVYFCMSRNGFLAVLVTLVTLSSSLVNDVEAPLQFVQPLLPRQIKQVLSRRLSRLCAERRRARRCCSATSCP